MARTQWSAWVDPQGTGGNAVAGDRIGEQIALQVGGAIVGGLLSSLLSNRR